MYVIRRREKENNRRVDLRSFSAKLCVYMYICIYVYMYICIYVYMYICIYVYVYICIHSDTHNMCTYICIYTHI